MTNRSNPCPELPDDTPLDQIDFPTRIKKALNSAGLKTVGEVRETSDKALLTLQDFGKGSVDRLRETVREARVDRANKK